MQRKVMDIYLTSHEVCGHEKRCKKAILALQTVEMPKLAQMAAIAKRGPRNEAVPAIIDRRAFVFCFRKACELASSVAYSHHRVERMFSQDRKAVKNVKVCL